MNTCEILRLKFPAIKFGKDVIAVDIDSDGNQEIKKWDLDSPQPTKEELDLWAKELDLEHRVNEAVVARNYPLVREQLDMLYHDAMNSTTKWLESITAVKEAHPKPTE
jgi:hypothetical protein